MHFWIPSSTAPKLHILEAIYRRFWAYNPCVIGGVHPLQWNRWKKCLIFENFPKLRGGFHCVFAWSIGPLANTLILAMST